MLFAIPPAPYVFLTIRPVERAFPVLPATLKVSFILPPIWPGFNTFAFNFSKSEFPDVALIKICEVILSKALKKTIDEVPLVVRAVLPFEAALTLLLALVELACILSLRKPWTAPGLHSFPVL
jgi:hypothetical protein